MQKQKDATNVDRRSFSSQIFADCTNVCGGRGAERRATMVPRTLGSGSGLDLNLELHNLNQNVNFSDTVVSLYNCTESASHSSSDDILQFRWRAVKNVLW